MITALHMAKGLLTTIAITPNRSSLLPLADPEGCNLRDGVQIGRKGWLRPENVVNTWSLAEVLAWLGRE